MRPSVACDATGRAILLWTGVSDDLGLPLAARWFDTGGQPQGNELVLAGDERAWAAGPHLALSPQGTLLLAYEAQDHENTADAWAAGDGNLSGVWPTSWHHDLDVPASKAFVATFQKKHGQPPENHAWIEYISFKMLAQAMNETKSTDTEKLIAYFEKETQFDVLKARKAYFRSWDHQLMQEAYSFTVKPKGKAKDKYDFLQFSAALPAPNQSLELLATTKAQNTCVL